MSRRPAVPVPPSKGGRPRPTSLRATEALVRDVRALYDADRDRKRGKARGDELDERYLTIRARLIRRILPGYWRVGDFLVRRTVITPEGGQLDLKAAIDAGVIDAEKIKPFIRPATSYEKWDVVHQKPVAEKGEKAA